MNYKDDGSFFKDTLTNFKVVLPAMFLGFLVAFLFQPWVVLFLDLVAVVFSWHSLYPKEVNFMTVNEREVTIVTFCMIFLFFSFASMILILYFFGISVPLDNFFVR